MAEPRHQNLIFFQDNRCYLCGNLMARRKKKNAVSQWRTLDHILPRSRGGAQCGDNVALAHQGCNVRKGNRMPRTCEVLLGKVLHMRMSVRGMTTRAREE